MKIGNNFKVIGMMSGTSLDGLDIACCEFRETENGWTYKILEAETVAYPKEWESRLAQIMTMDGLSLSLLHVELGNYYGKCLRQFIDKTGCNPDFAASHGHTVYHQPDKALTLQVGAGPEIAAVAGIPVACDFRTLDVALGGQGAPLVPVGDKLLLHEFDACLNLGGIANISYDRNSVRIAYDIGPCNMTLNWLIRKTGRNYDADGAMTASGTLNNAVLDKLNALSYYREVPPKSLGLEYVEAEVFPLLESGDVADMLRTSAEHTAHQIAVSIRNSGLNDPKVLLTGGGTFNSFLVGRMRELLGKDGELIVPESLLIEYKEAMVFAFLGLLRHLGRVNVLSSVTGARKDSSGGVIYG